MFTGLVEEVGQICDVRERGDGRCLTIAAREILHDVGEGDSIAVDGVCLTVEHFTADDFSVQAVSETVSRTTLAHKSVGDAVNLERALSASARMGGHFVQGHVDGIGRIISIENVTPGYQLIIRLPENLTPFVVDKGSIALDGLSLTVARIDSTLLTIAIIPHTWQTTTLKNKRPGDCVNVEVDVVAKYVQKLLQPYDKWHGLSLDKLSEMGF
ncbi:riboflavin synthase [candidate division KSB1 bacterium]|nr:riboflavin synthase [candidate division KSB1 bacterium]